MIMVDQFLIYQTGHGDIVYRLVHKGAVVNAVDYHGSTPLHMACQRGHANVAVSIQLTLLLSVSCIIINQALFCTRKMHRNILKFCYKINSFQNSEV